MIFMTDILKGVLLTLSYSDQFDTPLSASQVFSRLILTNASLSQVNISLSKLLRSGLIVEQGGLFALAGRQSIFSIHKKRRQYSTQKRKELAQFVQLISWLPWVKAIFLTGSVTQNNAIQHDDLDFMMVCQNNRLWLARPIVVLLAALAGKRRSWSGEEKNSWCLNLWLEEDSLQIDVKRRNIYTAFEVAQAELLFERDLIGDGFYQQNKWIQYFLPNIHPKTNIQPKSFFLLANILYIIDAIFGLILDLINWLAYKIQIIYMRSHKTREEVSLSKAFFHPRDTRGVVNKRWRDSLFSIKPACRRQVLGI